MSNEVEVIVSSEDPTNIRIIGARTSFAFVMEPDEKGKYRCQFLVPENAKGVAELKEAILAFGKAKVGKGCKYPIIKCGNDVIMDKVNGGDEEKNWSFYTDQMIIAASSTKPFKVIGNIYSGCYVAAQIKMTSYEFEGQKGVRAYLNGIKFIRDGENLGGGQADVSWFDNVQSEPQKQPSVSESEAFEDDVPF